MKPLFQPRMVNGPFEDPVLYLDFLFERRALLLDVGNIRNLATRQLLRISDVFVSHTHMDHFADLDWLLRLTLGREKQVRLFGPAGFIEQVEHKLGAYTWNLVHNYETDLTLVVSELHSDDIGLQASFRCRHAFAREDETPLIFSEGVLVDETALQVRAAVLDHDTPCLGFAVHEKQHVNLWKNRLDELELPVGAWLQDLKQAVLDGQADDTLIRAWWRENGEVRGRYLVLGELKRQVVRIVPGQKVSYIVDVAYRQPNIDKIVGLVRDSHVLFIETTFLDEEAELAASKCHLTARQAGMLARQAGVKQLQPIHFSSRYSDRSQALRDEAQAAFLGR